MPKRSELKKILVIGAGPIVIGQACEFDYSGVQACKALKELGYKVVLVNSNPATIMTDPNFSDATYIEPLTSDYLESIIDQERPDAILPTMGGQTALNCVKELDALGLIEKYNIELIGCNINTIDLCEDRQKFTEIVKSLGLKMPKSAYATTVDDAKEILNEFGLPVIIRAAFTLGGAGSGIARTEEEFFDICQRGIDASPISQIEIDESVLGWKEFELEVVRDYKDNCIVVCSVENIDPMGVHTGDSITVAPIQTLTDKEYQQLRNAAFKIIRAVGVDTGGANVQFALNPDNGEIYIVEMNPRVSRSSALASKATGFPIAKVAAKLAVGFSLDELKNEITGDAIPASFEPTLDYVVTKIPRFAFEKFEGASTILSSQMRSVGEVMAIGRTFQESFQKAYRSLEKKHTDERNEKILGLTNYQLKEALQKGSPDRIDLLYEAFYRGASVSELYDLTKIDCWFLNEIKELIDIEQKLEETTLDQLSKKDLYRLKQYGFSDKKLGSYFKMSEIDFYKYRTKQGIKPVYKKVDSCAAEFLSPSNYLYSTYDQECESEETKSKKIVILGSGPNRIGQGIEFDYCCVHAALAIQEKGYEAIMVNCNPETVSTDFDISSRLYFEPILFEHVMEIIDKEKPEGVILHFGGQTPLKLAQILEENGVCVLGTSSDTIDLAEDRKRFSDLLNSLDIKQPQFVTAVSEAQAFEKAKKLSFPLLLRPSFVLGGQSMKIVESFEELKATLPHYEDMSIEQPLLIDEFITGACEYDVDALSDGQETLICGIVEHIDPAGVHSGDSAAVLPPQNLSSKAEQKMIKITQQIAQKMNIVGLFNIQFLTKGDEIYVIEVNPRASRTVPFISKANQTPWADLGTKVVLGDKIRSLSFQESDNSYIYVKESVFPFHKFSNSIVQFTTEMRSTGEVMGIGKTIEESYLKAQYASGFKTMLKSKSFIFVYALGVNENDKKILCQNLQLTKKKVLWYDTDFTICDKYNLTYEFLDSSLLNISDLKEKLHVKELSLAIFIEKNGAEDSDLNHLLSMIHSSAISYAMNLKTACHHIWAVMQEEEKKSYSLQMIGSENNQELRFEKTA